MDSAILLLDCGCINHQSYPVFDSSIVFHSNFSVHEEKDSLKVRSKVICTMIFITILKFSSNRYSIKLLILDQFFAKRSCFLCQCFFAPFESIQKALLLFNYCVKYAAFVAEANSLTANSSCQMIDHFVSRLLTKYRALQMYH